MSNKRAKMQLNETEITPSELRSALISAIDAHNERSEFKVAYSDFWYEGTSIFIKGEYQKDQVMKIVHCWGEKVREFTNLQFDVSALYFAQRANKTLYHRENFNV